MRRRGTRRPVRHHHVETTLGEQTRERPRTAPDVQHAARLELLDHRKVGVEVTAIGIERVVQGSEPRIRVEGVRHGRDSSAPRPGNDGFTGATTSAYPNRARPTAVPGGPTLLYDAGMECFAADRIRV